MKKPVQQGQPLTRREQEVLALAAQGLTGPQIADHLFISERTVDYHRHHIILKTGVHSLLEALARRGRWVMHRETADD